MFVLFAPTVLLGDFLKHKLSERIDNVSQFSTEWISANASVHSFWELQCILCPTFVQIVFITIHSPKADCSWKRLVFVKIFCEVVYPRAWVISLFATNSLWHTTHESRYLMRQRCLPKHNKNEWNETKPPKNPLVRSFHLGKPLFGKGKYNLTFIEEIRTSFHVGKMGKIDKPRTRKARETFPPYCDESWVWFWCVCVL